MCLAFRDFCFLMIPHLIPYVKYFYTNKKGTRDLRECLVNFHLYCNKLNTLLLFWFACASIDCAACRSTLFFV